ncbi:DUF3853 family protein [Parabacteroides faecalis]|nr:DUF3853 family protein [Parabacteroides faecalis]
MYNPNTPISFLTVGDLMDIVTKCMSEQVKLIPEPDVEERKFVYGLKGLADLLGCSVVTAHKIKNSGVIDNAITQIGKKIIVDADLALNLIRKRKFK